MGLLDTSMILSGLASGLEIVLSVAIEVQELLDRALKVHGRVAEAFWAESALLKERLMKLQECQAHAEAERRVFARDQAALEPMMRRALGTDVVITPSCGATLQTGNASSIRPSAEMSTPDQVAKSLEPSSFKKNVGVLDSVLAAWAHMERLVGLLCPVILGARAELTLVRCPVAVALESVGPTPWNAVIGHVCERQVEASFGAGECPQERFSDRLKSPRGTGDWTYGGLCLLLFSF